MAHETTRIDRTESLCSPGSRDSGIQKRKHTVPMQGVAVSSRQNTSPKTGPKTASNPKDLGRPAKGWMPRDKIMALVRQIDAGLTDDKDVNRHANI